MTPRTEAGVDATTKPDTGADTGTDASDGGVDAPTDSPPDRIEIQVEAGTVAEFFSSNAGATCERYKECCGVAPGGDPAKFDTAGCIAAFSSEGWVQSLTDLSVAGVADGGLVKYDPVAGGQCLTAIRNMTCANTTAAEFKSAWTRCYAAASGLAAPGSACKSNVECATTAYCDTANNGGTCTALKAAGSTCNLASAECSYRNAGTAQCVDDGTGAYKCGVGLANGKTCQFDRGCASGACSVRMVGAAVVATCEATTDFLFGICDFYKLP